MGINKTKAYANNFQRNTHESHDLVRSKIVVPSMSTDKGEVIDFPDDCAIVSEYPTDRPLITARLVREDGNQSDSVLELSMIEEASCNSSNSNPFNNGD